MLRVLMAGCSLDDVTTLSLILKVRWHELEVIHHRELSQAREALRAENPDVVFICFDCNAPESLEFIGALRATMRSAFVLLYRELDALDRIKAFELGADECMPLSWQPMEILARLNAILRRTMPESSCDIVCGRVRLDTGTHEVSVSGNRVDVSPREFNILSVLARRPDHPVSHDELLTAAWGPEYRGESELLRKSIFRLRRKLKRHSPDSRPLIVNTRGNGYALAATNGPALAATGAMAFHV